jgi:hypothetical protein
MNSHVVRFSGSGLEASRRLAGWLDGRLQRLVPELATTIQLREIEVEARYRRG